MRTTRLLVVRASAPHARRPADRFDTTNGRGRWPSGGVAGSRRAPLPAMVRPSGWVAWGATGRHGDGQRGGRNGGTPALRRAAAVAVPPSGQAPPGGERRGLVCAPARRACGARAGAPTAGERDGGVRGASEVVAVALETSAARAARRAPSDRVPSARVDETRPLRRHPIPHRRAVGRRRRIERADGPQRGPPSVLEARETGRPHHRGTDRSPAVRLVALRLQSAPFVRGSAPRGARIPHTRTMVGGVRTPTRANTAPVAPVGAAGYGTRRSVARTRSVVRTTRADWSSTATSTAHETTCSVP